MLKGNSMQILLISNLSRSLPKPIHARYCNSFLCRLRGLTFRRSLMPQEGLLLVQPQENRMDASIHMLFMMINLTVVWINEKKVVVDIQKAHRWGPFYIPASPASFTLEIAETWLPFFQIGDQLDFEDTHLP